MISVVIQAGAGDEERLARTLASLVPAAVEGAVREAIVVNEDRAGEVARVADHAGCRVAASLAAAVEAARGDWLLLLEPGARLLEGWSEVALAHVGQGGKPARLARDASVRISLRQRLRARGRPLARGLLIARREASSLGGGMTRLRLVTLPARIVPAG